MTANPSRWSDRIGHPGGNDLNWPAIGAGALASILIGVPVVIVGSLTTDGSSALVLLLALITLCGSVLAGVLAAGRQLERPRLHGVCAALVGFLVCQSVAIGFTVLGNKKFNLVAVPFNAAVVALLGMLGAAIAPNFRQNHEPENDGRDHDYDNHHEDDHSLDEPGFDEPGGHEPGDEHWETEYDE